MALVASVAGAVPSVIPVWVSSITELPTTSFVGYPVLVTDAEDLSDCDPALPNGTVAHWCIWNGSSWTPTASLAGPASSTVNSVPTFSDTSGQFLQDPATMYAAGGSVAIGTSSLFGDFLIEDPGSAVSAIVRADSLNDAFFRVDNGVSEWDLRLDATASDFTIEDNLAATEPFRIEAGAPDDSLVIDTTGKIGLGLNNPSQLLHVRNTGANVYAIFEADDTFVAQLVTRTASQVWHAGISTASDWIVRDNTGVANPFIIEDGAPANSLVVNATSGDLSMVALAEIDGLDPDVHEADADAHREHATLEESAEIDGDILTHAGISAAHHTPTPAGAPTNANYLTGSAQAGLSAEIVVGTTPGGQLGGTWGSPTVDTAHAADGSNCSAAQAAQGVDNSHAAQSCIAVAVRGGEAGADNVLMRWNGTTGLQGSGVTLSDTENLTGIVDVDVDGIMVADKIELDEPVTVAGGNVCRNSADGDLRLCTSTRRNKTAIRPSRYGLAAVLALAPREYETLAPFGVSKVGLIAEEVGEAIPEALEYQDDGQVVSYDHGAVISALVNAVKQLTARVKQLEAREPDTLFIESEVALWDGH